MRYCKPKRTWVILDSGGQLLASDKLHKGLACNDVDGYFGKPTGVRTPHQHPKPSSFIRSLTPAAASTCFIKIRPRQAVHESFHRNTQDTYRICVSPPVPSSSMLCGGWVLHIKGTHLTLTHILYEHPLLPVNLALFSHNSDIHVNLY